MEFREKQAIYLQIAEYVFEEILLNKWQEGDKILSIRDLAIALEVNPNTVQRTYDFLSQQGIIANRRGLGFFVEPEAALKIMGFRREQFLKNELPNFFRNLYLLKIDIAELPPQYEQFISENFKNT
jgi:GntR family transcriptional regulator